MSFPRGFSSTKRIINYARGLRDAGDQCYVKCVRRTENPDNPIIIDKSGIFEGIKFDYLPSSPVKAENRLISALLDLFSVIYCFFYCLIKTPQNSVVISYCYSPRYYFAILMACKFRGIKIFRELCEYPLPDKTGWIVEIKRFITLNVFFKWYSGFLVISHSLKELAEKYGSNKAKIIEVPILVQPNVSNEKYVGERPYIFHGGTLLERKDAIVTTIEAFGIACKELNYSIDFILAGPKSPHIDEINKIVNKYNIQQNIKILPPLNYETITKYQNGASLCVLNKHDNLQNRNGFSTKLGEVLLSETPVVTTYVGEAKYYLKDGESAYFAYSSSAVDVAKKIVYAFKHPNISKSIALKGKEIAINEFNYKKHGLILSTIFNSIYEK